MLLWAVTLARVKGILRNLWSLGWQVIRSQAFSKREKKSIVPNPGYLCSLPEWYDMIQISIVGGLYKFDNDNRVFQNTVGGYVPLHTTHNGVTCCVYETECGAGSTNGFLTIIIASSSGEVTHSLATNSCICPDAPSLIGLSSKELEDSSLFFYLSSCD